MVTHKLMVMVFNIWQWRLPQADCFGCVYYYRVWGIWCLTPLSTIFQLYRGCQLLTTRTSAVVRSNRSQNEHLILMSLSNSFTRDVGIEIVCILRAKLPLSPPKGTPNRNRAYSFSAARYNLSKREMNQIHNNRDYNAPTLFLNLQEVYNVQGAWHSPYAFTRPLMSTDTHPIERAPLICHLVRQSCVFESWDSSPVGCTKQ